MSLCSAEVEVSVYHRTFQVTGKGFSMVAASVFNMKLFTSCENDALESSLLLLDTRAPFVPWGRGLLLYL